MPNPKPGEAPLYTGMVDCVGKTVKYEGVRRLYKGKKKQLMHLPKFIDFMTAPGHQH